MKKRLILFCVLCFLTVQTFAAPGINFLKGVSWLKLKERARREHKFIFVDIYTSWCVPCRYMAKNIFPQKQAGDFFNKYFLSVAVQFDKTKNDGPEVKQWYKDVESLKELYKVEAYPTYLFFNPDGELVHVVMGSSSNAADFIDKAKKSLNPETQYIVFKRQYINGNRDSAYLSKLTKMAQLVNDESFLPEIATIYLKTQSNLTTHDNLQLVGLVTKSSTDPGFSTLLNYGPQVDAALGRKLSGQIINQIAFDEVALPYLRENGKKQTFSGGLSMYSGQVIKTPDWADLRAKLNATYPNQADAIIAFSKEMHQRWVGK